MHRSILNTIFFVAVAALSVNTAEGATGNSLRITGRSVGEGEGQTVDIKCEAYTFRGPNGVFQNADIMPQVDKTNLGAGRTPARVGPHAAPRRLHFTSGYDTALRLIASTYPYAVYCSHGDYRIGNQRGKALKYHLSWRYISSSGQMELLLTDYEKVQTAKKLMLPLVLPTATLADSTWTWTTGTMATSWLNPRDCSEGKTMALCIERLMSASEGLPITVEGAKVELTLDLNDKDLKTLLKLAQNYHTLSSKRPGSRIFLSGVLDGRPLRSEFGKLVNHPRVRHLLEMLLITMAAEDEAVRGRGIKLVVFRKLWEEQQFRHMIVGEDRGFRGLEIVTADTARALIVNCSKPYDVESTAGHDAPPSLSCMEHGVVAFKAKDAYNLLPTQRHSVELGLRYLRQDDTTSDHSVGLDKVRLRGLLVGGEEIDREVLQDQIDSMALGMYQDYQKCFEAFKKAKASLFVGPVNLASLFESNAWAMQRQARNAGASCGVFLYWRNDAFGSNETFDRTSLKNGDVLVTMTGWHNGQHHPVLYGKVVATRDTVDHQRDPLLNIAAQRVMRWTDDGYQAAGVDDADLLTALTENMHRPLHRLLTAVGDVARAGAQSLTGGGTCDYSMAGQAPCAAGECCHIDTQAKTLMCMLGSEGYFAGLCSGPENPLLSNIFQLIGGGYVPFRRTLAAVTSFGVPFELNVYTLKKDAESFAHFTLPEGEGNHFYIVSFKPVLPTDCDALKTLIDNANSIFSLPHEQVQEVIDFLDAALAEDFPFSLLSLICNFES